MELESSRNFVQQPDSVCIDACTHMQNIPDLCLIVIFSDKTLDLMDLCCIAESCDRFRSITQSVIGKILTFTARDPIYQFVSNKYNHFNGTRSDAERLMRTFGWCVKEVLIASRNHKLECYSLSLIKDHCDEGLKLLVHDLQIPANLTHELKFVLEKLHSLKMYEITIDGNNTLFSGLNSLIELNVTNVRNSRSILENVFPQLQRFHYITCKEFCEENLESFQAERLQAFISSHPGLKFIDIFFEGDQNRWNNINQAISSSCSDLQELRIRNSNTFIHEFDISLKPLQALKSLKNLTLISISIEYFEVFAPMTGLRELRFERCKLPTNAHEFACLAQIRELFLISCVSRGTYDVADIIQPLVDLVKLKLTNFYTDTEWKYVLNATTFSNIVNIVKGRSNVLELICRCDSSVRRVSNQNVKLVRLSRK